MVSGAVSAATIKKETNACRDAIFHRFGDKMAMARVSRHFSPGNESTSRVTRSSTSIDDDDWVIDMDAVNCSVTDIRRLDRYCLEHIFNLEEKTKLMLLVSADDDNAILNGTGQAVDEIQRNGTILLSGRTYYRLQCSISDASDNMLVTGGLASKMYNQKQFQDDFNYGRRGFQISFHGTSLVTHFTWKNLMARPLSLLFFGPPLSSSRSFDSIFKDAKSSSTLHRKFMCYYSHFFGDANACLSLHNAYLSRRLHLLELKHNKDVVKVRVPDGSIFRKVKTKMFMKKIDDVFQQGFVDIAENFQNHCEPIVPVQVMHELIAEAEIVFGDLWHLLLEIRGSANTRDGSKRDAKEKKRLQQRNPDVFFQLLLISRTAHRQSLPYWALVSNVSSMARGVGRAAETAFAYFGTSLSQGARHRLFTKITGNNKDGVASNNTQKDKWTRLFRGCRTLTLCYDNYQRGLTLQHQRGKHSSAFWKGTHQCAHKMTPFEDDRFDDFYANFTLLDQAVPSPMNMPAFETIDADKSANFFLHYSTFESMSLPDFTGDRVRSYMRLKNTVTWVKYLRKAFPRPDVSHDDVSEDTSNDYFDQCPGSFNRTNLRSFQRVVHTKEGKALCDATKSFQRDTVLRWNPNVDKPSLSIFLGLVGIDESASKECGALTLDLLLRAGVLLEGSDGKWILASDYESRRIYLVGDGKTVENIVKFVRDMQDRRTTFSDASVQAEVFLKAMSVVMTLPGDWHSGLNIAQSIFSYSYHGFLEEFQQMLGWKRINKDVSSSYFQSTRLIMFVFEELTRFFVHQYVSEKTNVSDGSVHSPSEFIVSHANGFGKWMESLKDSADKWISSCAVFWEMAHHLLEFINAYRVGDAVAVEVGYHMHLPRAEALGQKKYVNIILQQSEVLYRDNKYSRLQEWRINRFVRRYDASTGKRCVCHDEFLEHGNRFFSEFPLPRSLVGFAEQSLYVGYALMCRAFTNLWYTTKFDESKEANYSRTAAPGMTPERRVIYKVFCLLETHIDKGRSLFCNGYVKSVEDRVGVDLKRVRLEKSMHDVSTSADGILISLDELYAEAIAKNVSVSAHEEVDDIGKETPKEVDDRPQDYSQMREAISKKTLSPLLGQDPSKIGGELLVKKNLLAVRAERERVSAEKTLLRECITQFAGGLKTVESLDLGSEVVTPCSWQTYVREHSKNLKL